MFSTIGNQDSPLWRPFNRLIACLKCIYEMQKLLVQLLETQLAKNNGPVVAGPTSTKENDAQKFEGGPGVIYPHQVAELQGWSNKYASEQLNKIRHDAGLAPRTPVPVPIFCKYTGHDVEFVLRFVKR